MDPKELREYDVVVNVQGDEPGVNPKHIDECIDALRTAGRDTVMSTLVTPIVDERDAHNRNVVKCVADCNRYEDGDMHGVLIDHRELSPY